MSKLQDLRDELVAGHPVTGAYSTIDKTAAAEMNAVNRTRNKDVLSGSLVLNAINVPEFNALLPTDQQTVWNILHLSEINPFGVESTIIRNVFGSGSETVSALGSLRRSAISRAEELGFGTIREGHIQVARS